MFQWETSSVLDQPLPTSPSGGLGRAPGAASSAGLRVDTLTPSVTARPGATVPCTVRVHNDGNQALSFSVRVVGLTADAPASSVPWAPLAPGDALDVEVDVTVPESMTPGDHSVAIEVMVTARAIERTDNPRVAAASASTSRAKPTVAMAPLVVKVASLDQVVLRTSPTVVRGRRGGKFSLEVINKRHDDVVVDLAAEGASLQVDIEPRTVTVAAGDAVTVFGRVRAPRLWRGDERQHVVNVEGGGSAVPTYTRFVFRQRPVIARGVRGFAAVFVVLAVWAAAVGGAALWVVRSSDDTSATEQQELVDTDGDGVGDTPAAEVDGTGTDGDGGADGEGGADGGGGGASGTDPDAAKAPTSTLVRGVVKAGKTGNDEGVVVTLTPLVESLDEPGADPAAAGDETASALQLVSSGNFAAVVPLAVGGVARSSLGGEGKFWSARYGTYGGNSLTANRATVSVTAGTDADGSWLISDVPLRRSYEISFSKPGFDRQSFQVTPPDDGKPVELEVELQPAAGALGGIVTGPNGGLGGVDLVVTDGTLTFSATTSTVAGSQGRWLIEGLSTPATYTVTATLDGYSTAVAQITLGVGEQLTDLSFGMRTGAGSIGGVVRGAEGPIGGVTLTATGEGEPRTTNSLTAGATGSYLFPELEIPGTYTVTASAPGYITQTRLVTLSGNATGIDLEMVRTTASITGFVTTVATAGDTGGVPLPNASVEIDVEALQARASTAGAPDAGSFTLVDLPPGTYTISFGHYEHLPDSRLVTLTAGQVLDLGEVPLVFQEREQLNPNGSVSVSVRAASTNAALPGATITLTDVARRLAPITPPPLGAATSVVIPSVPVGVYEVVVTVPNYRPYVVPRLPVGVSDIPVPVVANMLQYGQAFGQVVDGLAPAVTQGLELISGRPLNDYRLLVYEVVGNSLVCAGPVNVLPGAPVVQGRIRWEVDLGLQLLSGDYVLRFSAAPGDNDADCAGGRVPAGYAALPDAAGNVASFTVPENADEPIQVPDISVYPYPRVTGVVQVPSWDTIDGEVVLDPATSAIAGLTVQLRCGSLTATAAINTEVVGPDTFTTFTFTRATVAAMFGQSVVPAGGVLGNCNIVASATGLVTVDTAIPTALRIPTSGLYDDRALAIVLADDPADLVGTTAWTDAGTGSLVLLGGSVVSANGAIVGFGAGQGVDTDGPGSTTVVPGSPAPITANISATANGSGQWVFATTNQQQVAGTSTYNVAVANFQPASFTLLVDEGTRAISATTGLTAALNPATSLDLRLTPLAGEIAGDVQVLTGSTADRRGEASVNATPPGGVPVDVPVSSDGQYLIDPAAAGTWQLDFRTETGSNLVVAPGQVATAPFVGPAATVVVPTAQYWDLAQVDVQFRDTGGATVGPYQLANVSYPRVGVTQQSANTVYPTFTASTVAGDSDGFARFLRLPVDLTDPVGALVSYEFAIAAPGFDLTTATWEVFADDGTTAVASGTNATSIAVSVAAGTRLRVAVALPAYGAIVGAVSGLLRPPSLAPADVEALTWDGGLVVSAQQVADAAGTPLASPPAPLDAVELSATTDSFRFDVASGFYAVTYSHPDFVTRTIVYTVGIDTEVDGSAALDIALSTFTLTVITDTTSETPVGAATVGLWPTGTTVAQAALITPTYSGVTDANGVVTFSPGTSNGLIPGGYLLIVRKADLLNSSRDGWFPVIATITAPRGPDELARTLSRRAVMPQTQGSLVGTVSGVNLAGRAVPLPSTITINRTYTVPQAGGTDGLPNNATEANQIGTPAAQIVLSPGAGDTTDGYTFGGIAGGVHTLAFVIDPDDGFDTVANVSKAADQVGPTTVDDVELVAIDRTWRVRLVDGTNPVPGLSLSATGPEGDTLDATEDPDTPGTYEFVGVMPEVGNYTLVIDSDYHVATTPSQLSVNIEPSASIESTTVAVTRLAIIAGSAFRFTGETTQVAHTVTDGIRLVNASTGALLQTTTADAAGGYQFVVSSTTAVRVQASQTGFTSADVSVSAISLGATVTAPTLALKAYATLELTVGGTPGGTALVVAIPSTGVTVAENTPGVFTISGLDPDQGYVFGVSATGFATRNVPATGTFDPAIGGNTVDSVVLEALRTISGTVVKGTPTPLPVPSAAVRLMSGATQVAATTAAADGTFSFSGVGYGTYTIQADRVGFGTGVSASVPVIVGGNVTLSGINVPITTVRQLTYTFAVTPATTRTITFSGVTGAVGQSTFVINEDASRAYSVVASGYLTASGTAPLPSSYVATAIPVPVTITPNSLTGTVTGLTGGATVYLCQTTDTSCIASPYASSGVNASGTLTFTFTTLVPGSSYRLFVRKGSTNGAELTITVDPATGVVSGTPATLVAPA